VEGWLEVERRAAFACARVTFIFSHMAYGACRRYLMGFVMDRIRF
jgi:hypothetical protein